VAPENLAINPDCGLRHLLPDIARAKLAAMVAGAALVRAELAGPAAAAAPAPEVAGAQAGAKPPGPDITTRPPVPSQG
jgi:5-methyltetrahydropteroyltriglutamate--homocysteine methyltransferase